MRLIFEITIFTIILIVATAIGALIILLTGAPLNINVSESYFLSVIGIGFVLPGTVNIFIMLRGNDGESTGERICAGIRGLGMLLCAIAFVLPMIDSSLGFKNLIWVFVVGSIFWLGSVPFEDHFQ